MLPEEATETKDKDLVYFRRFDKMQRDFLKTLVIAGDHRRAPPRAARPAQRSAGAAAALFPPRSRRPTNTRSRCVEPFKAYRIVALSGHRGVAPRLVEDKIYPTQDEAYHALFMRRVQDLLET